MKERVCPICHAKIKIKGKEVQIIPAKRSCIGFYKITCRECKEWIKKNLRDES